MKQPTNLKTMLILAFVACAAFAFGSSAALDRGYSAYAAAPSTFEMLGMAIRYDGADGEDGIRFGVKLDLSTYNALIKDDNAVAGILVTPTDMISGESLTLWTASLSKAKYGILYNGADGTNEWNVFADHVEGAVYLHGFPEASYNRPVTAIGYIDWNNDGVGATVYHSDTVGMSMSGVALGVLNDYKGKNTFKTTAEEAEKLGNYLLDYDVEFYDENGSEYTADRQTVRYGNKFTFPSDPEDVDGRPFLGWVKGTGSTEWSADLVDAAAEAKAPVKAALKYKACFGAKVKYTTRLYNKENIYGADPSVTYRDGYYYYTYFDSQQRIYVSKSRSLEEVLEGGSSGWGHGDASCIYTPKSGDELGADIWAPELEYLDGKWYIYVCGVPYGYTHNTANERMFVLECKGDDPTGEYKAPVLLCPNGFSGRYAIDGHAFYYRNKLYYTFSGQKSSDSEPRIYICTMSDPTHVNNDAVNISKSSKLEEGPCTIVDGDDLYLMYSLGTFNGKTTSDDYHVQYYKLTGGTNPLNASQWTAKGTCLQHSTSMGIYCTGHNHIFKDADGSLWTSYHAVVGTSGIGTSAYLAKRRVFVQPITITDGVLSFGGIKDTFTITEQAGLAYYDLKKTQYYVNGVGSGRLWANGGEDFSVSATITRLGPSGSQFCAGVTLYERKGDGNISKLLIGVEREGNLFFCKDYSRRALRYKYVGYQWSDKGVANLTVAYTAGASPSTSKITITIADATGSKSKTWAYTLTEINALVSDAAGDETKAFDLHFTGDFEIGLGGNLNRCSFTNVSFYGDKYSSLEWRDDWGNEWETGAAD